MKVNITEKMYKNDKMYGTTSLGARGQVVIPAEARKDLDLHPGDKLVVMGKMGKALGLVKAEAMQEIVAMIMEKISAEKIPADFKKHIKDMMKQLKETK